jgi:excinuclease ABC subunit A
MADNQPEKTCLHLEEASEHFLKAISCRIPHDALTVVTGVSGSGKSSLAFDTLCREGQRRFLETFSVYARRFLGKISPPAYRRIAGLRAALAVAPGGRHNQPRSTVGTMTDLYDSLRVLFARLGSPHCPACLKPFQEQTTATLSAKLRETVGDRRVSLFSTIIQGHRGSFRRELEMLRRQGINEVLIDGDPLPLSPLPVPDAKTLHTVHAVIARNVSAADVGFSELVKTALKLGKQALAFQVNEEPLQRLTVAFGCPECGNSPPEIGPRLFSFNSPYGACPVCQGLGVEDAIDPALLIGDSEKSVREGALVLTTPKGYIVYSQVTMEVLDQVCRAHGFSVDIPWKQLSPEQQDIVFFGSDRIKVPFGKHPLESRLKWTGITARPREEDYYKGIIPTMEAILKRDRNPNVLRFVRSQPCHACRGNRLNSYAQAVFFQGKTIAETADMPISALRPWLENLQLDSRSAAIGGPVLEHMQSRMESLASLGLGHLSLNRSADSLSAGEWQLIRLVLQSFSRLSEFLYVLDEPSLGLHPRDQENLLNLLFQLRDSGNTILAVEHRRDAILAADWMLDMGPGAGPGGGEILFEGRPEELLLDTGPAKSATREWLSGGDARFPPSGLSGTDDGPVLQIIGATQHHLKDLDVSFPLGALTAVTGVSGAGKSTLVTHVLARHLRRKLHGSRDIPGLCREVRGWEFLNKVIAVDQQPIGRNSRSNPATYTGVFDHIRDLFARQPASMARGFTKSRFSWNTPGGRCEACDGSGVQEIGMHLLETVEVPCEECRGNRYLPETLAVLYLGHSIADVLHLTIDQAIHLFAGHPPSLRILQALANVGLGYLTLGQSSTTLSGGEAQRVKLATELARPQTGKTLYILDEPATGLHHADIKLLIGILRKLTAAGNTVITVEHHPEFLLAVDWIIDLGPEGGAGGGSVVVAGTPAAVSSHPTSHTGKALSRLLQDRRAIFTPRSNPEGIPREIRLEGVATHNLRDLSVTFPKHRFTVVTGVSGSGKSSLVMDTLYAEGHRRYLESLSAFARRFIRQAVNPVLRSATGLSPVIAVRSPGTGGSRRSTVGTVSGCLDFLRLLFARLGKRHCPACGRETNESGCEPCHFVATTLFSAELFSFNNAHGACPACRGLGSITTCDPARLITHPTRSILDGAMDGTKPGRFYGERDGRYTATLREIGRKCGIDFSCSWEALGSAGREIALHGCQEQVFRVVWEFRRGSRTGEHVLDTTWPGFMALIQVEYDRKRGDHRAEAFAPLMSPQPCPDCRGERLKPEFAAVRWRGKTLGELGGLEIDNLHAWLKTFPQSPSTEGRCEADEAVAEALWAELSPRLEGLSLAGLGYLSLDRPVTSLSGGEYRRLVMAGRIGGDLTGITYLLDEPTIGLHAQDTARLISLLERLRDQGNTVIVVEHDPDVIRAADFIMEIGPGSGTEGGRVVAAGSWKELQDHPEFETAKWLGKSAPWPHFPRHDLRHPGIEVRGARRHNLKGLDVDIPLGGLVVLTGVSGSGKTTLLEEIVYPSLINDTPTGCLSCRIAGPGVKPVLVHQQLPSGSPNSLVATVSGLIEPIGKLFASTADARKAGFSAGAFSPFGATGQCPKCKGLGGECVELDFLAAVNLPCEECGGTRFRPAILSCRFHGQSIAEVLAMPISEAFSFFAGCESVLHRLKPLQKVGLGHLSLGRAIDTLSAGERQRLRLASALAEGLDSETHQTDSRLFLFDEPTTGLHLSDIARLEGIFQDLLAAGHSLIVIEHHLEIIRRADWIIDMGPGGGERGGNIIATGTPEALAGNPSSATSEALRGLTSG